VYVAVHISFPLYFLHLSWNLLNNTKYIKFCFFSKYTHVFSRDVRLKFKILRLLLLLFRYVMCTITLVLIRNFVGTINNMLDIVSWWQCVFRYIQSFLLASVRNDCCFYFLSCMKTINPIQIRHSLWAAVLIIYDLERTKRTKSSLLSHRCSLFLVLNLIMNRTWMQKLLFKFWDTSKAYIRNFFYCFCLLFLYVKFTKIRYYYYY